MNYILGHYREHWKYLLSKGWVWDWETLRSETVGSGISKEQIFLQENLRVINFPWRAYWLWWQYYWAWNELINPSRDYILCGRCQGTGLNLPKESGFSDGLLKLSLFLSSWLDKVVLFIWGNNLGRKKRGKLFWFRFIFSSWEKYPLEGEMTVQDTHIATPCS